MTSLYQEARDNVRACRKRERDVVEQFDYDTPVKYIVNIIPQHIRDASTLGLTVLNIDLIRGSVFLNRRHVYDLLEAQNSEIRYKFWEHLESAIEAEFKDFGIEKSLFDISINWKD